MATYNGQNYVIEQLDSIRNQTIAPYKVIIRDDCSTDNTVKIMREYLSKYSLKNWEVIENGSNIGYTKNFLRLINDNCQFDILLSDQDDIWDLSKIETILNFKNKHKEALLITTAFHLVNNDGKIIKSVSYFAKNHKVSFNSVVKKSTYPGMTFYISKELLLYPQIDEQYLIIHDYYYALLASSMNGFYRLNKKLVNYRQHSNNCIGASKPKNSKKERIKNLLTQIKYDEMMLELCRCYISKKYSYLNKKLQFDKKRLKYFENNELFLIIFSFIQYNWYTHYLCWFIDLYYCIRFRE